jgi:hypothetical protein
VVGVIFLIFFYLTRNLFGSSARFHEKLYHKFFWNDTLRVILESYQPIVLLSFQQVFGQQMVWNSWVITFLNVFDIVTLVVYVSAPFLMTLYFRANFKQFRKPSFKKRFADVIEGLSSKRKSAANFFSIFCYRRLCACLLIVLYVSKPYA